MKNLAQLESKSYDPRWFIWTVVFLIVSGVSLVSYIIITTTNDNADAGFLPLVNVNHRQQKQ
jgi:hypothetical protein